MEPSPAATTVRDASAANRVQRYAKYVARLRGYNRETDRLLRQIRSHNEETARSRAIAEANLREINAMLDKLRLT